MITVIKQRMQSVQAYLEIGHWAWCRSPEKRQRLKTHDWVLFVRGKEENQAIHHFVEKVVFHLHESFVPSMRGRIDFQFQMVVFHRPNDIFLNTDTTHSHL